MPKSSTSLALEFRKYVQSLENTRRKMESLLNNNNLDLNDIEKVYDGLYINLFTEFASLIEDLFFGLLKKKILSPLTNVVVTISPSSGMIAQEILLIGKNYIDWLPYEKTIERAKIFFKDGIPFTLLNDGHKSNLKRYIYIRNALTHKSEYSLQQFNRHVIGSSNLTPREKTPTGFLRSIFRRKPNLTQYENVARELKSIIHIICQ